MQNEGILKAWRARYWPKINCKTERVPPLVWKIMVSISIFRYTNTITDHLSCDLRLDL